MLLACALKGQDFFSFVCIYLYVSGENKHKAWESVTKNSNNPLSFCGQANNVSGENKHKAWEKPKKGKKKGGKAKKKAKQPYQWKAAAQAKIDKENAAAASVSPRGLLMMLNLLWDGPE